ncbi:MAG: hypothetical protein ACK4F4_15310 [Hylemonella sp.]|uniref:hypothetical protein n=1 Tax=Hylemonella sp. TaxID=2066020 RepID=UPI00391D5586
MQTTQKSLKEQLSPIAKRLREGQAVIRPVSQITLRLKPIDSKSRFEGTVDCILQWISRRAGRKLPDAAWNRKSFELTDIGAQRTAAISLVEPKYWAARLDDADKSVPLRTWVTEIGVGVADNGDVLFGSRLICTTRGTDEPYIRTIPGFVRQILATGPAELDGHAVEKKPRILRSDEEIAELVALLERPDREADVLVIALPEKSTSIGDAILSIDRVGSQLQGVAHVIGISGDASFFLTDRVGKELSVFRQAVRVYRPGFRSWVDQPSNHPLFLPNRIQNWASEGAIEFENWLIEQTLARTVYGIGREDRLPAFNTVRQLAAQAERSSLKTSGGSDADMIKLFEQDNDQLRNELKEQKEQYDGLLATADLERSQAEQAASAARSQALERLHRIRILEQRLKEISPQRSTPIPSSIEGFEDWCKENLVGAVEVVGRAIQAVRKSDFHDPQFIYRSLLLMRDHYVPMRVEGTRERRDAYQSALRDLQLEESLTGDGVKYATEQYSVSYGGSRRALDRHLKGSNSRDRRYGFRLYFFWDEEGEVVVVGWLPTHLDNRLT